MRSRGRPAKTYVDSLRADTGLNDTGEMGGLMADRVLWRQRINTRTLKPPSKSSQVQLTGKASIPEYIYILCITTIYRKTGVPENQLPDDPGT